MIQDFRLFFIKFPRNCWLSQKWSVRNYELIWNQWFHRRRVDADLRAVTDLKLLISHAISCELDAEYKFVQSILQRVDCTNWSWSSCFSNPNLLTNRTYALGLATVGKFYKKKQENSRILFHFWWAGSWEDTGFITLSFYLLFGLFFKKHSSPCEILWEFWSLHSSSKYSSFILLIEERNMN